MRWVRVCPQRERTQGTHPCEDDSRRARSRSMHCSAVNTGSMPSVSPSCSAAAFTRLPALAGCGCVGRGRTGAGGW